MKVYTKFLHAFNIEQALQQSALMKISIIGTILAIIRRVRISVKHVPYFAFWESTKIWIRGWLYRVNIDAFLHQWTGSKCRTYSGLSLDTSLKEMRYTKATTEINGNNAKAITK
jgi:hypothetical protein